jgi:hypothetical protein
VTARRNRSLGAAASPGEGDENVTGGIAVQAQRHQEDEGRDEEEQGVREGRCSHGGQRREHEREPPQHEQARRAR